MGRVKLSDYYPILRWENPEDISGDAMYKYSENVPLTKQAIDQMFDCWKLKTDQALDILEEDVLNNMRTLSASGVYPYRYIDRQSTDILTLQDWTYLFLYIKELETNGWWETVRIQVLPNLSNFPQGGMPNSQPLTRRNMYQVRKMLSILRSLIVDVAPYTAYEYGPDPDLTVEKTINNFSFTVPLKDIPPVIGWLPAIYQYYGFPECRTPADTGTEDILFYYAGQGPISPSTGGAGQSVINNGKISGFETICTEAAPGVLTISIYSAFTMVGQYQEQTNTIDYPDPQRSWYDPQGGVSNDFSEL